MQRTRLLQIIVVFLAISAGAGLGYKFYRGRMAALEGKSNPDAIVRVLALKGVLAPSVLRDFERESGIRVALTESETPESLWDRLEAPTGGEHFDLVTLLSYQVPLAVQSVRLQPLDPSRLRRSKNVSADFRDIPGDLNHQKLVPIFWGLSGMLYDSSKLDRAPESWHSVFSNTRLHGKIALLSSAADLARWLPPPGEGEEESEEPQNDDTIRRDLRSLFAASVLSPSPLSAMDFVGKEPFAVVQMNHGETAFLPSKMSHWKYVLPDEGAGFWILSLALAQNARSDREAHIFLDYLLDGEVAAKLSLEARLASTNSTVEALSIDQRLKPSYLRKVPLTKVFVLRDFQNARAIRTAIGAAASVKAPRSN